MKKVKRVIIGITIIVCCVFSNLKSNAIYYAKYMPHKEGSYPELRVLIDNLWWYDDVKDGTFKYKIDGDNTISKISGGEQLAYFSSSGVEKNEYNYHDIEKGMNYYFDDQFNLIWVSKSREYKNLLGKIEVDEKAVKQQIYEFLKPIVDYYDSKPLINLQWLFNWLHQDKFN